MKSLVILLTLSLAAMAGGADKIVLRPAGNTGSTIDSRVVTVDRATSAAAVNGNLTVHGGLFVSGMIGAAEADPVFLAAPAANVTTTTLATWNATASAQALGISGWDRAARWVLQNGAATTATAHARSHALTSTLDHTATAWQTFYSNGSGQVVALPMGTTGQRLMAGGVGAAPSWADLPTTGTGATFAHTALVAHSAPWAGITSKPTTFTAAQYSHSAHTAQVAGKVPYSGITALPTTTTMATAYAHAAHTVSWAGITGKPATYPFEMPTTATASIWARRSGTTVLADNSTRLGGFPAVSYAGASHVHTGVYEPAITAGTSTQFLRGNKTFGAIGLSDLPTTMTGAGFAHQALRTFSAPWLGITGKPSTFTPAAHAHLAGDLPTTITGATFAHNAHLLDGLYQTAFARANHTHVGYEPAITGGTHSEFLRGDKVFESIQLSDLPTTVTGASLAHTAREALSVTWGRVTGKPSTFTPASHAHLIGDLPTTMTGSLWAHSAGVSRGAPWSGITGKPSTYAPSAHNHVLADLPTTVTGSTWAHAAGTALYATGAGLLDGLDSTAFSRTTHNHSGTYEPAITAGTASQYWKGNKTWATGIPLNDLPTTVTGAGLAHVARTAYSAPWTGISGKPTTYAPAQHVHTLADLPTTGTAAFSTNEAKHAISADTAQNALRLGGAMPSAYSLTSHTHAGTYEPALPLYGDPGKFLAWDRTWRTVTASSIGITPWSVAMAGSSGIVKGKAFGAAGTYLRSNGATTTASFSAIQLADIPTTVTGATLAHTARSAYSVPWAGVTDKPTTVTGSTFAHMALSAYSVPWLGISGRPSAFTPTSHAHLQSDIPTTVTAALNASTVDGQHANAFQPKLTASGDPSVFLAGDLTWKTPATGGGGVAGGVPAINRTWAIPGSSSNGKLGGIAYGAAGTVLRSNGASTTATFSAILGGDVTTTVSAAQYAHTALYSLTAAPGAALDYFPTEAASGITNHDLLQRQPTGGAEQADVISVASSDGEKLIDEYATASGSPGLVLWRGGIWQSNVWASVSSAAGTTTVRTKIFRRTTGGSETLLGTITTPEINSTTAIDSAVDIAVGDSTGAVSDRLVVRYYAVTTNVSALTVSLYYEGTTHYSHVHTPLSSVVETDPVFLASPVYGITAANLAKWNAVTWRTISPALYTNTPPNTSTIAVDAGISSIGVTTGTVLCYTYSGAAHYGTVSQMLHNESGLVTGVVLSGDALDTGANLTALTACPGTLAEVDPLYAASAAAQITAVNVAAWNAPRWAPVASGNFTATPASKNKIDVAAASGFTTGTPVSYTYASTTYYGQVSKCYYSGSTLNGIDVRGAALQTTSTLTALYKGTPELAGQVDFYVPSTYADAANTALLDSDCKTAFRWNQPEARVIGFAVKQKTNDTGAAQPKVNVRVNGNRISNEGGGLGVTAGTSWVLNGTVNTYRSNLTIGPGGSIEIECGAKGTNGNAADLTVSVFVVFK